MPKWLRDGAFIIKIDYVGIFKRFLMWMTIKIARLVQELQQFFCMTGFCLFVELHQDGSAPATCTCFPIILKKIDILHFFLAGSRYNLNRILGLTKTNLCFVLLLYVLAKVWQFKIFLLSNVFFLLLISWNSFYNFNSS